MNIYILTSDKNIHIVEGLQYCVNKYWKPNPKVILLGYKENIFKYLKDARAFLLTSLWEDPGFVLVESAYCNIPIISSDCKNGPEEFLNHGKGGMLFKSNSKISFLSKIQEFENINKSLLEQFLLNSKLHNNKVTKQYDVFLVNYQLFQPELF